MTGLALYGLAHAPQADAQYPGGGGGYPGSYGWHPLKPDGTVGNDSLSDPSVLFAYEWTKLNLHRTSTGSSQSDSLYLPNSSAYYLGDIKSSNGGTSVTMTVSGTSTLKYQWVPPLNAQGVPDWTNFPAPPLFVLAREDENCFISYSPDSSGISSSGQVSDGWGWTASFNGFPWQAPVVSSDGIRRKVIAPPAGLLAVVKLTPSGNVQASRTVTGSEAQGGLNIAERLFPILLSQPNPLTNPLLGDGTNQFIYSADTPDGYLYVSGAIQVSGGGHDDSEWLINNNPIVTGSDMVDVKIEGNGTTSSSIPNVFTHQWAVSNGIIYVNTPQNTNNPYPGYQFNNWIFKGLPSNFSSAIDGRHEANLYVQGTKSQTANIQTFYQAQVSNYPYASVDNNNDGWYTPNWYHYFFQAFPKNLCQK